MPNNTYCVDTSNTKYENMPNTTNGPIKDWVNQCPGSKCFRLEAGCVAGDKSGLIGWETRGRPSRAASGMQALLLELWKSLCFQLSNQAAIATVLFSKPLPGGENSCDGFMCKILFMYDCKTLSEEEWKSLPNSQLWERAQDLQTTCHSSFTWGRVQKLIHWDPSLGWVNIDCCGDVFRGPLTCSSHSVSLSCSLCLLQTRGIYYQRSWDNWCPVLSQLLHEVQILHPLPSGSRFSNNLPKPAHSTDVCWEPASCSLLCEHWGLESKNGQGWFL